nr:MAG TPA: hypothetical protein [Caudoviricetes sp.]
MQVFLCLLVEVARQSHLLICLRKPEERCVDRGRRPGLGHVVLAGNDRALVAVGIRGVADARRNDATGVLPWVYLENPAHISAKIPECRPERRLRGFLERRCVCAGRDVPVLLLGVLKDELSFLCLDLLDGDVHGDPPFLWCCAAKGGMYVPPFADLLSARDLSRLGIHIWRHILRCAHELVRLRRGVLCWWCICIVYLDRLRLDVVRLVCSSRHVCRDLCLDRLIGAERTRELCLDRRVLEARFEHGLLRHLVKVRCPWGAVALLVCLAVLPGEGVHLCAAHDVEAVAAALGLEHGVVVRDRPLLARRRHVPELWFEPELVLEHVVLVDFVRLDDGDLPAAIREIEKPLVAELELALEDPLVFVRDEVRLPERRVRLDAELRRLHHRAEEALRRALAELLVRAERREHHARESLRGEDGGQCLGNLPLHRHDEVFDGTCALLDCHSLFLRFLDRAAFYTCHDDCLPSLSVS